MAKLRVGILFGGRSAEHEVSILSARNVYAALDRDRFEPVLIGVDRDGRWLLQPERLLLDAAPDPRRERLEDTGPVVSIEPRPNAELVGAAGADPAGATHLDVVFPVMHGPMGEDGTVQGLLELADLAYVGAGVLGAAVGMDKDVMKRLLRDAGIPVADFRVVRKPGFERDPAAACAVAAEVGYPLFVKPANMGSSVGISRVTGPDGLPAALALAFQFDHKALAEAAVTGRELECSVLDGDPPTASLAGEVIVEHRDGFYSYDAKYIDEQGAVLRIPAQLTAEEMTAVQQLAVLTFTALEGAGLARVDFFLRPDGQLLVNEINTMPGFTAISMYPKLWEASGLGRVELVSRLIDLAVERKRRARELRVRYLEST